MPTPWARVKQVFAEALEREPSERADYLKQACGGDEETRAKVEQLLSLHESEGELLDASVVQLRFPKPFKDGDVIAGRFRIIRLLGSGGMGRVYEAEDLELGGHVALKTLHPELLADTSGLRRFRREIQLARKVTHPNVCRIFDVGHHKAGGHDYTFVSMELLEGQTLSQRIRSEGAIAPAEALRLARQMARGLDALHSEAVIHRDFKPSNIILVPGEGAEPRPVITDFGLARTAELASEQFSEVTRPSQVVGTPEYMAPEQLTSDPVSTATDVYALGIVLYEMVTGRRPFTSSQFMKAAVEKATTVPESPSKFSRGLGRRWEAALKKCLAVDPEKRFQRAGDVIRAIEGTLSVREKRMGPAQAAGKQGARVLGVAAAVLLLCAILVAAISPPSTQGLLSWIGISATPELPETIRLAILPFEKQDGLAVSEEFLGGLTEAVTEKAAQLEKFRDSLLIFPASEVSAEEFQDVRQAAEKLGANLAVAGKMFPQENGFRVEADLINPLTGETLASFDITNPQGDTTRLRDSLVFGLAGLLGIDLSDQALAEMRESSRPETSQTYAFYLQGRGYLQRHDELENVNKAIQLFHRALGEDTSYGLAYAGLGEAHWRKFQLLKEPKEAELAVQHASAAATYSEDDPAVHVTLGIVHLGRGREEEAVADFHRALELDPRNAVAMRELGRTYESLNALDEAEATYKKAIELRPQLWTNYSRLGGFYHRQGRYEEAAEQFQRVVELTPDSSRAYVNLGATLYQLEKLPEARQAFERSVEIQPRYSTLTNLGTLYFYEQRYSDAIETYKRALELNDRDYRTWANLAEVYHWTQNPEATAAFEEASRRARAALEVNPSDSVARCYLASFLAFLNRDSEALQMLTRVLEASSTDVTVLLTAGKAYLQLGRRDKALELVRQAIKSGFPVSLIERDPAFQQLRKDLQENSAVETKS